MTLTSSQCKLLIDMFNASLTQAVRSGIPVGKEYYDDIDEIKEKLYSEYGEAIRRESGKSGSNS